MRDVKLGRGEVDTVTSVHKCSLPHSKIGTRMINNIYPDYKGLKQKSELS